LPGLLEWLFSLVGVPAIFALGPRVLEKIADALREVRI
jgi:hypothetical protein